MNISQDIRIYILSALAAIIALTFHEFAHGYAAYKMGDATAKNFGRLTFNPIKHLDIVGFLCIVLFRFGWAKPVPINARNFKNPKRGFAVSAIAGPLCNLILGFFTAGIFLLYYALLRGVMIESEFLYNLLSTVGDFLYLFFAINLGLAIFNLLPVPPMDGSRILNVILPERLYFKIMEHERKIYLFIIVWLLAGDMFCRGVRMIPLVASTPWLYSAAGIFSLSSIIGAAVNGVADLFIKFWQLIPYLK